MITEREVRGFWYEALQQALGASWLGPIATDVLPSDQDEEKYPWIGQVPQMQPRIGPKQFQELYKESWIVRNDPFQTGIRFPLYEIENDKTGQVQLRIGELADRSMSHWAHIAAPLILNGTAGLCFDGKAFFADDHESGKSGAQDNLLGFNAVDPASPTMDEAIAAIMVAINGIVSFKDDQGEYCNEMLTDFQVLCGTGPIATAMYKVFSNRRTDGGGENLAMMQDSFNLTLSVSPRFNAWTDRFAVFATQGRQRPIMRQQHMPSAANSGYGADGIKISQLWVDSEHCMLNDECLFSVDTRRQVAYGDWKKAALVVMT